MDNLYKFDPRYFVQTEKTRTEKNKIKSYGTGNILSQKIASKSGPGRA